ncbi:hypothetical protein F0U59_38665 [Archangium gephyra]|nr:hypothetical protein F0U59_38665 [Archangium gephyra]
MSAALLGPSAPASQTQFIAVIGTGNMGRGLARILGAAGHDVVHVLRVERRIDDARGDRVHLYVVRGQFQSQRLGRLVDAAIHQDLHQAHRVSTVTWA